MSRGLAGHPQADVKQYDTRPRISQEQDSPAARFPVGIPDAAGTSSAIPAVNLEPSTWSLEPAFSPCQKPTNNRQSSC